MPFTLKMTGTWALRSQKAGAVGQVSDKMIAHRINIHIDAFMRRETLLMVQMVGTGWIAQGIGTPWKPISPWTVAGRKMTNIGGEKALIASGEMHKSLVTQYDPKSKKGFCGILYQTKRKDGKGMVNIAKIHEFGAGPIVIKMTPKMIMYLRYLSKFLPPGMRKDYRKARKGGKRSSGVIIINIPARPFFGPARMPFAAGITTRVRAFFKDGVG
jgi:hypothetical protein